MMAWEYMPPTGVGALFVLTTVRGAIILRFNWDVIQGLWVVSDWDIDISLIGGHVGTRLSR